MRDVRFLSFFAVVTLVLTLGCLYLGRRLITPSTLSRRKKRAAWLSLAGMALLQILAPWVYRSVPTTPYRHDGWMFALAMVNYLVLGFLAYLFFLQLFTDLGRGARRVFSKLSPRTDPSRRQWLGALGNHARTGVVGMAALSTGGGYAQVRSGPRMQEVEVRLPRLPKRFDGYTIAQVTDLHVGPTIGESYVRHVVDAVNSLSADAVVLTGDFVDGTTEQVGDIVRLLGGLQSRDGVFYVTGNHEYFWGGETWVKLFSSLGHVALENEHRLIRRGDETIAIGGVPDYSVRRFRPHLSSDPSKAFEGVGEGVPRILLAHQPNSIFAAADAGVDLQISGHTHAGQFIPWSFLVGLVQPYVSGLNRHTDRTWIYVGSGTGYWGPPVRLGVPSEITKLVLRASGEGPAA